MFRGIGVQLSCHLLRKAKITEEEANILTTIILDKLQALPFSDILKVDDQGQLIVNGTLVDMERARMLRESAIVALRNQALNLIRDQVAFTAVTTGVHKAETPVQMIFARAALWWSQQELQYLELLAQQHRPSED